MSSVHTSDARTELWLWRTGSPSELRTRLAAFDGTALDLVLCPPGGEEERWAAAFARAAPLERTSELAAPRAGEPEVALAARAWAPVEAGLARGLARVHCVLPFELLRLVVARALGLTPQGAAALRVDPGRAVLLRNAPSGLVLRRSNVLAPDAGAGTALPDGRSRG